MQLLVRIDWLKSLRFNFQYLSFADAIRLPILVYWKTRINCLKGSISIQGPLSFGQVRIGDPRIGVQDHKYSRTVWQLCEGGQIVFNGGANLGRGSRICVEEGATLCLGDRFSITGDTTILCHKSIVFGEDCLLSWDVLVMDTDWHRISDSQGMTFNPDKAVSFGDHVWIGCRSTVLKGAKIPSGCVIAAGSIVAKPLPKTNTIYGGCGKDICSLRENIIWNH